MNRRTFLSGTGALGALTLAGCMADDDSDGDTGDTPSPAGGDDPTPAITGSSIERTDNGCASGDSDYASTSMDENAMTVTFSGRVETGNPCHQPTLEATTHDTKADRLTITVGIEAENGVCVDCVGYIDFSGTVAFEGGLPGDATVVRDGEPFSPASGGTDSETASDSSITFQASSFSVTGISPGSSEERADAAFDEDGERVVVTGTIVGSNGCMTADVGSASYEKEANQLDVNVVTKERDDGGMCTQQFVGIDYEATFSFDSGVPSGAAVSHNGHGVMSAGYGSSSASGPDGNRTTGSV